MKWDPTITSVTVGGAAAAKVKTKLKNYEDGGRTAVVNVSADFVAGDQVTIADLRFVDFATPAVFDNLELEVFKDGLLSALDEKTVNIVAGPVNILSDEDQSFGFSDIATTISPITVTDAATPAITAANDIRIRIPAAIEIVWDGAATTAILGGPAASKVSGTVSYEDLGKTLVLDVTADFAAGDHIVIAGLRYTGFAPPSGLDFLELLIDGGTVVIDTDDHSLSLHGAFISSALDQTFIVNEAPKQAETITITDDTVIKTIKKKKDLRIRIPAGFPMTWDTSITTVTLGGGAQNKVSATLKAYEDNGQTVVLDVEKDFAAGEVLTIDGLFFANFSLPSLAVPVTDTLELEVGNDGSVAATDVKTITVDPGPTTLTSVSDQVFYVGDGPTPASILTIINDSALTQIKKKTDIRVTIPAAVDMTWDPSVVTITVGGNAWDKVKNAVTYENVGGKPKILVIDVSGDFGTGDYITVDGLSFRDFLAPVGAGNLLLTADPGPVDTDDFFVAVVELGLSSASSQSFFVSDPPAAASILTVSDDAVTPQIMALNDIRIRIPAGFNMTWDSAESAVTLGGSAAAKVNTQILAYEDLDHTLVLDVTTDFAAGDTLIVNGVKFANFTAVSAADNLELEVYNDDNPRTLDDKTVTVATPVSPTLLSAFDQVFPVGAPVTSAATLTIANGTGAAIKDADNIRIRIPAGFNMSWDTSVGTVTLGGSASGKVNVNLLPYENGGRVLVLEVTADFTAGEFITVSGLAFTGFAAPSAAANLELLVAGGAGSVVDDDDDRYIVVTDASLSSAGIQFFAVGSAPTPIRELTITNDSAFNAITAGNDIRIRIPPGFNMLWDMSDTSAVLGGSAQALVSSTVSFVDFGRTLVLNVIADFAPSDTLTVRELSFAQFTDVSPSDQLELELGNDNVVTALDDETITIVTATYRSIGTTTGNLYTGPDATAAAGVSNIDFPSAAFGVDVGRGDRLVINPGGGATQEVLFILNRLSPTELETQNATVLDHSGGDPYEIRRVYNALQDWESDRGGDLKGESRLEVGVAYNDDVFLESLVIDGSTTDATHFMRLEVAQGHGHNGTDGTGVTIDGQNGGFSGILIQDDFTQVGGFELTRHRGADVAAIVVDSATNVILNRLLIHDFEDFSNNTSAVEASLDADFTLRNCIIFDGNTAIRTTEASASGTVQNCSIHRMLDYSVYEDQGVINVVNTIAMDSGAIDFDVVLGSQTTNLSSDGTGTFTASAINQFVSIVPNAEDYHLAATAAASIDAGTDLPAQFLHDIDGDVRAGTPWDIGADEFGAIVQTTLLTSASDQVFFVGAPETPAAVITVTDAAAAPVINTFDDILIRIPATSNMAWDIADLTAIMGGPAASKVSTTVSYADPKTLVIEVLTDFAASDYITVDGLSFAGFTGVSLPDSLELLVDGVSVIAVDDKTLTVTGPSMSSASNQSFTVGSPATVANQISILEDASAPSIFASDDIRIRIPPGFPMRWDASVPLVTLGGSAAVYVSAVPTYEDGGKTLVLNVTTDFLAGDVLTVDGAAFVGFVAPAAPVPLELEAHNDGLLSALDDKTKAVVADAVARIVSDWDQLFFEGDSSSTASPIHVTDGTTASITTGNDIRIRIPAGLDMEWDTSVSVGVSGMAAGKVSSSVAYEDLNKTVVVSVTTDFAASDHVTFSGLSFKTFIESPPGSLELEVLNDDAVTSTDPRTITIGPKNEVLVFTAKSTSTENRLEWLNPPSVPYVQTWIRAREDGVFPTGPFDGRLVVGQAGGLGATDWFVDTGLTNGTTVHYAAFVDRGGGVFSDPATTTGRPFDHVSGPVKWAYSTGATSMAPPGIRFSAGVATVFAVSNDTVLHSMYGGAGGGDWPPGWKPYQFKEPAQARPPVVRFTIGSATNGAVLIGSQDGSVYVIDADNGSEAWKRNIAGTVQAAPAGEFVAYGGVTNLLLVGTRDAAVPNAFVGLNVLDGSPAWDFQNRLGPPENGDGLEIGIISGGASIDYATNRAYFASRQATAESQNTLWCISFTGAQPTLEWARDIGDVDGSPILFNGVIYVGTVAGFVYAYDTSGTQLWSNTTLSDGPVKGFIFPQFGSPNVLLSTNTKVWSLDATGVPNWSVPLPSPSIPLFAWGTSYVIVGAGDGKLYQIDANNPALITSATLGDGSPTSVGAPSLDLLNSVIYVGTDAGIIYAVDFPLP